VFTSTSGSSQNMPREPLRTISSISPRAAASLAMRRATLSAPTASAAESRGT